MKTVITALIGASLLCAPAASPAQTPARTTVDPARVRAHVDFLAGPALRGRGSATRDEAIAAAYLAAQFQAAGLRPAPGMGSYFQTVPLIRQRPAGEPVVSVAGQAVADATLLRGAGGTVAGTAAVVTDAAQPLPKAEILFVADPKASAGRLVGQAQANGTRLLILPESDATRAAAKRSGGPTLPIYAEGGAPRPTPALVTVPAETFAALARPGVEVVLTVPFEIERAATTNAIAFLPGTDPDAGVILLSAHLDAIGVRPDGQVVPGANDDASGLVALMELARALGVRPNRRGILFVGYGGEEIGLFGARHFVANPPVPLDRMVANIQFEMIGEQDPKLPPNTLMMTGFERSTLGETLRAAGAQVAPDPYPDQNFFRRSDNYALALEGVVAHTVSGLPLVETYHLPTDTPDRLDYGFMVSAIRSLVQPIRRLANARAVPTWKPGGRPTE